VERKKIDVPACVHDVIAGLVRLRALRGDVGSSIELPLSEGEKTVFARVQALRTEVLQTGASTYTTICYEAFLFNGVLYKRKARLFIWISTDDRRVPVRVRIQLPFYVGTVSVELERAENGPHTVVVPSAIAGGAGALPDHDRDNEVRRSAGPPCQTPLGNSIADSRAGGARCQNRYPRTGWKRKWILFHR
jgi:hypothetical protein